MIQRVYKNNDKTLNFKFSQNEDDFIVDEQGIRFSNSGNFVVLKIQKTNMDTWELIDRLANFLGVYSNEIGYAGLKDKRATTTQYISIPKKLSKQIKQFRHKKIKILESYVHNKKLNIGDLKGNRFKINLYDVEIEDINHIQKILKQISKNGMPNYFGYQRFGKEVSENLQKAEDIINGELLMKDKKLSKMLIAAYQSQYFNSWLVYRLNGSNEFFDLLNGDVFYEFKNDKYFTPKNISEKVKNDFKSNKICATGLLPGRKVFRALGDARFIEEQYDNELIVDKGYRREAIVYPQDVTCNYKKDEKRCTLEFTLPKGSYATVLIENLANRNFS